MFMPNAPDALPCAAAREIIDTSNDWITVLSTDGRIRYLNRSGRRLVHHPTAGLTTARRWLDLWPSAERDAAHGAYAVALAGGPGLFRGYCPALDGAPHWWEVRITLLEDDSGAPDGLIAVARDISLERRVLDLEREARQARFAGPTGGGSHDILSALAVIKGEAQLLARRNERLPEPLRDSWLRGVNAINVAADRIRTLAGGHGAEQPGARQTGDREERVGGRREPTRRRTT